MEGLVSFEMAPLLIIISDIDIGHCYTISVGCVLGVNGYQCNRCGVKPGNIVLCVPSHLNEVGGCAWSLTYLTLALRVFRLRLQRQDNCLL